jgi:lycopene cyclase domain-containing protein
MNYLALNAVFMLMAFVILNVVIRKSPWKIISWTLLVMVLVTLIFDNLIVALGIVDYDTDKISGVLLGLVPIEDFAYTVVSVLAVSSIWHLMTRKK